MTHHPNFQFLVNLPDHEIDQIISMPPLASAVQNFETSLLLISLKKYPSALACCAMAIESAWKAATHAGQDHKNDFASILGEVNQSFPKNAPTFNLKDFRKLRNDVVHFGYSPKDDESSAQMIFSTGIPVFLLFMESHPNISINVNQSLNPVIFDHLKFVLELNKIGKINSVPAVKSSTILEHSIKRMTLSQSWWQESALDSSLGQQIEFDEKMKIKKLLHDAWHCCEDLICPVCNLNELVVRIDESLIGKRIIKGINAHCVNCDLNLASELLNKLLQCILAESDKEKIFTSYGF